jgi:hypothetical protein
MANTYTSPRILISGTVSVVPKSETHFDTSALVQCEDLTYIYDTFGSYMKDNKDFCVIRRCDQYFLFLRKEVMEKHFV